MDKIVRLITDVSTEHLPLCERVTTIQKLVRNGAVEPDDGEYLLPIPQKNIPFDKGDDMKAIFGERVLITDHMYGDRYEYDTEFSLGLNTLLHDFDYKKYNLVCAGGAVLSTISNNSNNIKDYDLFFYGITQEQAEKNLAEICEEFVREDPSVKFYRGTSVLTVVDSSDIIYQFILRCHKSKSEIIYGFDIGASQVLYDGNDYYCSHAGNFALLYRATIIDLGVRRHTYEFRLRKYYEKGYGILMPVQFQCPKAKRIIQLFSISFKNISKHQWKPHYIVAGNLTLTKIPDYALEYDSSVDYTKPYSHVANNLIIFHSSITKEHYEPNGFVMRVGRGHILDAVIPVVIDENIPDDICDGKNTNLSFRRALNKDQEFYDLDVIREKIQQFNTKNFTINTRWFKAETREHWFPRVVITEDVWCAYTKPTNEETNEVVEDAVHKLHQHTQCAASEYSRFIAQLKAKGLFEKIKQVRNIEVFSKLSSAWLRDYKFAIELMESLQS